MSIVKKLLSLIIVLLGVTMLTFAFSHLSPVDPAEAYLARTIQNPTQEQIEAVREQLGLNVPIHKQYINWISGCLSGDFGTSLLTKNPVLHDIAQKLPATLSIVGLAMVWIVLFTLVFSIACAYWKDSVFDHAIRAVTILGVSLPNFWLGFILLSIFAISIPMFKVVDFGSFKSMILPSVTLAIPVACGITRLLRSTIISTLSKEHVVYAKARGLSGMTILFRHVLKNSLPPVVTVLFQYFGYMIAGSAIVESVFSWPGLGGYLVEAIIGRDMITISGCVLVIAAVFVFCNLLADLMGSLLNPKLSQRGRD